MIARLRESATVRHGAIVFAGFVVASLFNYLYYMLMGRRLGIEGYGVVTSLASALLVVGAPATVGQLIAARLAADLHARGDRAALGRLADLVTGWGLVVAVVGATLGYLARAPLATFFHLVDPAPVVVTVLGLGLFWVVNVQRGVFQGAHHFADLAASMSIESLSKVLIGVVLAGSLGATGGLLGLTISQVFALGYNLLAFRRRFGVERSAVALDRALILRVISRVGMGQLTITILSFYDVPLVKHFFDPRAAGLYAAAALVGRAVLSAVAFIPVLVLPKATARVASGLSPAPLLFGALSVAAGIVGVAAVGGVVAPRLIVTIIAGGAFGEAAVLVLWYVLASGALALASVVVAYRIGLHQYSFVLPAMLVAAAEIVAVASWHPSLIAIVMVLTAGHACVLAVTLIGIGGLVPEKTVEPGEPVFSAEY